MSDGEIHITTRRPGPPGCDVDFAIEINFKKSEGRPERVFRAADAMIRALQHVDSALCVSIDSHIEPMMVLEEIEVGSIRIWLKNVLSASDDQAIKELDWKPAVGRYLVRAKYAYIRWANKPGALLKDLVLEMRSIAAESDVRYLPDYAPPSAQDLADGLRRIDAAKDHLIPGDTMSYIPQGEEKVDFDLAIRWAPTDLAQMAVKETAKFENMPMSLIVKRPDYLGQSKWDLRHGTKQITAKIEDDEWLARFQSRQIDVRPGDAIRCLVTIENNYGYDNELVNEIFTVTKVQSVLENQITQLGFYDDNP